jgi:hypothetical protein
MPARTHNLCPYSSDTDKIPTLRSMLVNSEKRCSKGVFYRLRIGTRNKSCILKGLKKNNWTWERSWKKAWQFLHRTWQLTLLMLVICLKPRRWPHQLIWSPMSLSSRHNFAPYSWRWGAWLGTQKGLSWAPVANWLWCLRICGVSPHVKKYAAGGIAMVEVRKERRLSPRS